MEGGFKQVIRRNESNVRVLLREEARETHRGRRSVVLEDESEIVRANESNADEVIRIRSWRENAVDDHFIIACGELRAVDQLNSHETLIERDCRWQLNQRRGSGNRIVDLIELHEKSIGVRVHVGEIGPKANDDILVREELAWRRELHGKRREHKRVQVRVHEFRYGDVQRGIRCCGHDECARFDHRVARGVADFELKRFRRTAIDGHAVKA